MGEINEETLNKWAKDAVADSIVSASEFISIPRNTIEGYVNGLIEIYFDTSGMSVDEVEKLREYLIVAANRQIEAEKG